MITIQWVFEPPSHTVEFASRRDPRIRPAIALIAALAVLVSTSCARPEGSEPTVVIDGTTVPSRIKIASSTVGGAYYPMGNAIAQVLGTQLAGVIATNEATSGSGQNLRMLDGGELHFGLANASVTLPAIEGREPFDKQFPVRAVISLHASVNLFFALEDSGITQFSDFAGKRVAVGPAGGNWDSFTRPILTAHGVSYADIRPVYEGQSNAVTMLTDRIVDAVQVGGSIPHATILAATATHNLEYLEFDEESLDSLRAQIPTIQKYMIPGGTYAGMDSDFWAVDTGTCQLIVSADADPDYVYLITKTIYENREMIADLVRHGAEITPDRAAMDIGIPYHEGSLRYFEEIGIWNPQPADATDTLSPVR